MRSIHLLLISIVGLACSSGSQHAAAVIGCEAPLREYFVRHPRLWFQMMYGPTQATQFRLRGPGKKVALAHEILMKLPVSTFNHIVKAGLRGRLLYGLKGAVPELLKGAFAGN